MTKVLLEESGLIGSVYLISCTIRGHAQRNPVSSSESTILNVVKLERNRVYDSGVRCEVYGIFHKNHLALIDNC